MIKRSTERVKQTGEVFTPPELVSEVLDKLPLECFTDPTKTFVDPACGDGNFLVQVLQRKIDNGSSSTAALNTTFGVDLMEDNTLLCRRNLLEIAGDNKAHRKIVDHNIVCANSLTEWDFENWEMKVNKQEELVDDLLTF